jgi:hypothetical protein
MSPDVKLEYHISFTIFVFNFSKTLVIHIKYGERYYSKVHKKINLSFHLWAKSGQSDKIFIFHYPKKMSKMT